MGCRSSPARSLEPAEQFLLSQLRCNRRILRVMVNPTSSIAVPVPPPWTSTRPEAHRRHSQRPLETRLTLHVARSPAGRAGKVSFGSRPRPARGVLTCRRLRGSRCGGVHTSPAAQNREHCSVAALASRWRASRAIPDLHFATGGLFSLSSIALRRVAPSFFGLASGGTRLRRSVLIVASASAEQHGARSPLTI